MSAVNPTSGGAYEALIQFLYQAPIGLIQTDMDGAITMINPKSAQLLMPLAPDGDLLNLFDTLSKLAPQLRELAAAADADGGVVCEGLRVELEAVGAPGPATPQTLSIRMVRLDHTTLVASVSDATHAVNSEQQRLALGLRDALRIDALTGLPSRVVALERIAKALTMASADPDYLFAVLLIDCDRFDRVNVTLGSNVGDELLRLVGARLNGTVRAGDGIKLSGSGTAPAMRIGGDQFMLVVQGMRERLDVYGVAQRVVDAFAQPFALETGAVHLRASVGVLLRAEASSEPEEVMLNATIAVHEAKRAGGARASFFDPEMKERASRIGTVESDLHCAVTDGQLFVVYQPIVAMADGSCAGMEALVRWRHPLRGIVPPIGFITVAEETGQIAAIGEFVLIESCRQLVAWQRELGERAPRTISVNVSRAQLVRSSFAATVRNALEASGLPARSLQLEITESLAAQDRGVIAQLHDLKALGLTLALDDFGTGYSSLSSLQQLPVDVVKIDRSFVEQVESSAHHLVLTEATVKVAQSLGMTTVAEGIETAGQFSALRTLGCDKGQGYLWSKPLGSAAAREWLQGRDASSSSQAGVIEQTITARGSLEAPRSNNLPIVCEAAHASAFSSLLRN